MWKEIVLQNSSYTTEEEWFFESLRIDKNYPAESELDRMIALENEVLSNKIDGIKHFRNVEIKLKCQHNGIWKTLIIATLAGRDVSYTFSAGYRSYYFL